METQLVTFLTSHSELISTKGSSDNIVLDYNSDFVFLTSSWALICSQRLGVWQSSNYF